MDLDDPDFSFSSSFPSPLPFLYLLSASWILWSYLVGVRVFITSKRKIVRCFCVDDIAKSTRYDWCERSIGLRDCSALCKRVEQILVNRTLQVPKVANNW